MAAQRTGEPIPEGWALDTEGNPTTDPFKALPGTMLPIGGAKGAALALMVEVLTAGLAGAGHAHEQSSLFSGEGAPLTLGQTLIAIDVGKTSGGLFAERLETLIDEIEAEPGARLPGTKRLESRARAASEGLTIAGDLIALIGQPAVAHLRPRVRSADAQVRTTALAMLGRLGVLARPASAEIIDARHHSDATTRALAARVRPAGARAG